MVTFSVMVDVVKVAGKGAVHVIKRVKADDMATAMKLGKSAVQAAYPVAKVIVTKVIQLKGNL